MVKQKNIKGLLAWVILFTQIIISHGQELSFDRKFVAFDRDSGDGFGYSASIFNDEIAIGTINESYDSSGNNFVLETGAVYVYERDPSLGWQLKQKLVGSNRHIKMHFGKDIDMNDEDMFIGVPWDSTDAQGLNPLQQPGTVYIYEKDGQSQWQQLQKIDASDRDQASLFGWSVDIDNDRAVVGSPSKRVGAPIWALGAGQAYYFEKNAAGIWNEEQIIFPSDIQNWDRFGHVVRVSGNFIAISSVDSQLDSAGGNPVFGAGAVYIFKVNMHGIWAEYQKIVAPMRQSGAHFGTSLALNENHLIIASHRDVDTGAGVVANAGVIYSYRIDSLGYWQLNQEIIAPDLNSNDLLGHSLTIWENDLCASSFNPYQDTSGANAMSEAGSIYHWKFENDNWQFIDKYTMPDRDIEDHAGSALSMYQNKLVVGAFDEDHEDTLGSNFMFSAGSAYLFQRCDIDSGIQFKNGLLFANEEEGTYKWFNCDSLSVIAGQTSRSYRPVTSGKYAVIVKKEGCIDTSSCLNVNVTNVVDIEGYEIVLFPNPINEKLIIEGLSSNSEYQFILLDPMQRIVLEEKINHESRKELNTTHLRPGVYFYVLKDAAGINSFTGKLIKP